MDQGKKMTSETRRVHSLTNCKACALYHSQYQATYPIKKMSLKAAKSGPLNDMAKHVNKLLPENSNAGKKQLKSVGQAIYSTYNDKCKKNFGKTLGEILVLVPEAGLQIKPSPEEKKREKRNQLRQWKKNAEKVIFTENDTTVHLTSGESYSARKQRKLAQCFETPQEALLRVSKISPQRKERSHTPALENIEGIIYNNFLN